jgi:flagellin-specific chaperone FliS
MLLKEIEDNTNALKKLDEAIKSMLEDIENFNRILIEQFMDIVTFVNQCNDSELSPQEDLLLIQLNFALDSLRTEISKRLQALYQYMIDHAHSWNLQFIPNQKINYAVYLDSLTEESLKEHLDAAESSACDFYPWFAGILDSYTQCLSMIPEVSPELQAVKKQAESLFAQNKSLSSQALDQIKATHRRLSLSQEFNTMLKLLTPMTSEAVKALPADEIHKKENKFQMQIFIASQFRQKLDPSLDKVMIDTLDHRLESMKSCIDSLRSESFSRRLQRDMGVIRALHEASIALARVTNSNTQVPPLQNCTENQNNLTYRAWMNQNTELQHAGFTALLKTTEEALVQHNNLYDLPLLHRTLRHAKRELVRSGLKGTGSLPNLNPMSTHKGVLRDHFTKIGELLDMIDKIEQELQAVPNQPRNRNGIN